MPMMQRSSCPSPGFSSLARLNSHLHLTGDLGRYCYSLVDREAPATLPYLCETQTSAGMLGWGGVGDCNEHGCF